MHIAQADPNKPHNHTNVPREKSCKSGHEGYCPVAGGCSDGDADQILFGDEALDEAGRKRVAEFDGKRRVLRVAVEGDHPIVA